LLDVELPRRFQRPAEPNGLDEVGEARTPIAWLDRGIDRALVPVSHPLEKPVMLCHR
jgi:hypothetical protein